MKVRFKSIGTIHTPHKTKDGIPIQSKYAKGIKGTIKLKKKYISGLLDLDGFSHIYLIYYFHKSEGYKLQVIPFLDKLVHGVFSTRAPRRPNAIGISVVKLISINDNMLEIENVEMLDGTPLLDIKPYIPEFDNYKVEKRGWFSKNIDNFNDIVSDDRFDIN
jgi:tRNA-Thr(GGU) m(6)t(6)A37 methyltransferase TsaA